ncbi:MAG: TonB-dependent receptor [Muribaculaceae bacterium]|nr:TonB-dependent receptor [Muribaculaceae bacterium]
MKRVFSIFLGLFNLLAFGSLDSDAQNPVDSIEWNMLQDFEFVKKKAGLNSLSGPEIGFKVNQTELFRAACCNLGESFTTNPSVDVSYTDAATGSKQIKLLGLSGNYVQLLAETLPVFRGAARPYALRYVPGPWLKSISVSKGSGSVKNGFESITGQIDIEYLKPQDPAGVILNAYIDSQLKVEANADANFHISPTLNTEILGHFEDRFINHDSNGDGFTDMPDIRQFNFQNRWNLFLPNYIMHAGLGVINERSLAGQIDHHTSTMDMMTDPYKIKMQTGRYEAYMKHAFILDKEHSTNIAWMSSGSLHDLDTHYGFKGYDVKEWNAYSQLMLETDFNDKNNLSIGLSYNYDYLRQNILLTQKSPYILTEKENTAGTYAQYTLKPIEKFTLMAGVRADWSSKYKWFVTPRMNIRYNPTEDITLRASAGKGYRTVFAWAEYNYLLASSRSLVIENLNQESSWNYGFNASYRLPINSETLTFSAEYYYTHFNRQVVVDYESPHVLTIGNLDGKSFSHTFQVEVSYESSFGLTALAAWRLNDVKTTYQGKLLEKPLTSKYKGLFTVSYSTAMDIWQFDLTLQLNGGGRMPAPYLLGNGKWSWSERFPSYPMLNFQATRWFRHFSIYAGAENITNYRQKNPIIGSADPWGPDFDSTLIWGPIDGIMFYAGIRFNFGKL